MAVRSLFFAAALLLAIPSARADVFDACREVFVAPIFLATHPGSGTEAQLGDAPPTRVEIRAKIEGQPDSTEIVVSPPGLAGDINAIGPIWPEKGSAGRWLPGHAGQTVDVRVLGFPLEKETVLGKFRLHLASLMSESGYALFSVSDQKVFALHIAVSAFDGERSCKGLHHHERPRWSMPMKDAKARPAHAMLESILRAHRCVGGNTSPECDLSRYVAEYRDVNGDKSADAILWWTAPGGAQIASQIWMRDASGELAPAFVGRCDEELSLLSPNVVRCTDGSHPTVLEFHHGHIRQRAASRAESTMAAGFDDADRDQEASGNLRAIYLAETTFHDQWHRFTDDWIDLTFVPDRGNAYSYYLGESGPHQRRDVADLAPQESVHIIDGDTHANPRLSLPPAGALACVLTGHGRNGEARPGLSGDGTSEAFTAIAVARSERNHQLDCWSVSSADRTAPDGTKIAAGEPFHHAVVRVLSDHARR